MLELLAVNHVARTTKRLEESHRFYIEVMGCREVSRPAFSFRGFWLYVAGIQFHLIEDLTTPDPHETINPRDNHVAFAVKDLDAMEEKLQEQGIPYRRNVITDRQIHQIFFRDPDGWVIEISSEYWDISR